VDPDGDCRFDRDGDKFTITVPGKGHELRDRLNAPRLLRDVGGDFVVQVRVGGAFRPAAADTFQRAGILLTDGTDFLRVERDTNRTAADAESHLVYRMGNLSWFGADPAPGRPVYLRLERRGDIFWWAFSEDGERWTRFPGPGLLVTVKLPRKVKVGVVAEATAPVVFKPEFDQFRLSRPGK
jgi:regulation of enolase protein 1 (concanavalin A-like superfamily)